jgi:hypothetical protein
MGLDEAGGECHRLAMFVLKRVDVTLGLKASGLGRLARTTCATLALGGLAGCDSGSAALSLGLVLIAWPLSRTASAGAPRHCPKRSPATCTGGLIATTCCSDNPDAPECRPGFEPPPFMSCGNQTCVLGRDPGRCTAPANEVTSLARTQCTGLAPFGPHWREVCVDRKLTQACIPGIPTNFSGPARVADYQTCGANRCTTHLFIEDCFPTTRDVLNPTGEEPDDGGDCRSDAVAGRWQKVCLGGKVDLRCIPTVRAVTRTGARAFVMCPDKSCAVGNDPKRVCP